MFYTYKITKIMIDSSATALRGIFLYYTSPRELARTRYLALKRLPNTLPGVPKTQRKVSEDKI